MMPHDCSQCNTLLPRRNELLMDLDLLLIDESALLEFSAYTIVPDCGGRVKRDIHLQSSAESGSGRKSL